MGLGGKVHDWRSISNEYPLYKNLYGLKRTHTGSDDSGHMNGLPQKNDLQESHMAAALHLTTAALLQNTQ